MNKNDRLLLSKPDDEHFGFSILFLYLTFDLIFY